MASDGCFLDEIVDRRNTNSIKWDTIASPAGKRTILPMWVADMDFRAPDPVLAAMRDAVEHGVFGYAGIPEDVWHTVSDWANKRYGWEVPPEWFSYTAGVITGLNIAVQTFTRPGEKIVIQPPVYPPFHSSALANGRHLIYNNLLRNDEHMYRMDLKGLSDQIDADTRMLVLCSPHNPVGRCWSRQELENLADLCVERDLIVFSDEIHADLLLDGRRHTPFAALGPEIARRTITGIAPSKTFNIAGLKASVIITPDAVLHHAFDAAQKKTFGLYDANTFAVVGMQAAYRHGEQWLDTVLEYLKANRDYAVDFIEAHLPGVHVTPSEATFLLWLDFSPTGLTHDEVSEKLEGEARVLLNDGRCFGANGEGFFRFNFGCPRETLRSALQRIADAFSR